MSVDFVPADPAPEVDSPIVDTIIETLAPPPEVRPVRSPLSLALPSWASERIQQFDHTADRWFDQLRGRPTADRLFYGASALGDFSLLWHLISLARVVADPTTEREALRMATALAVESVAVNVGVKAVFRRERPAWAGDRPHDLRRPRSSSFPSGHATSGFLAAGLLAAGRPRQRALWYGLAGVVAASRVHVRIHHASDVVGGALLGLSFGALVRRGWPLPPKGRS
jgi:membrane-associated phospholipid phosphatase